jgi:transposase
MGTLPEWVLRHRGTGKEIRLINGRYYLYRVRGKYDPAKGRTRKITEAYLGKITPDGLMRSKHERMLEAMKEVSVKEYGASSFMLAQCSELTGLLTKHYPDEWRDILSLALVRLFHSSPLKNVLAHYASSHLSDALPGVNASPESLGELLRSLGQRRERATEFMKSFIHGGQTVIDLTHVFSLSEGVISATLGHNGDGEYVPQVNMVLLFSLEGAHPSFFRLVPGSVSDVSTVTASLREAGASKSLLIGDKGIYSVKNVAFFESSGLEYILPLKRNSGMISYSATRSGDRRSFDGHFAFDERVIWYKEKKLAGKRRLVLFLDEGLKAEEEKDYMSHVRSGKLTLESYYGHQYSMGTISVMTRSSMSAQKLFELLKRRVDIEQVFDTFKNTLHADRSYMRDDVRLQGWMFVNFVALLLYYRVYDLLMRSDALSDYSPRDVIMHLSRIYKLRIGDRWMLAEVPKSSRKVLERLKLEIPIP